MRRRGFMVVITMIVALSITRGASATPLGCEAAIVTAAGKLADASHRVSRLCEESAVQGRRGPCPDARAARKLAAAKARFDHKVEEMCGGTDATCGNGDDEPLASVGWGFAQCPSFVNGACANAIADCGDVRECLSCVNDAALELDLATCFGAFVPSPRGSAAQRCQLALCEETFTFATVKRKALAQCWKARAQGRHGNACPNPGDGKASRVIRIAAERMRARICETCGGSDKRCDGYGDVTVADLYGGPRTCPDVTVPGGDRCRGNVETLGDAVDCLACSIDYAVDCTDALRVPWAGAYPAECRPTPTATAIVTPTATPTPTVTPSPRDLAFANFDAPNRVCRYGAGGTFSCVNVDDTTYASSDVAVADLDRDGHDDLVFANEEGHPNTRCLNDGAGTFSCAPIDDDTGNRSTEVAVGDFNHDHAVDLVFAHIIGAPNRVCLGDGTGQFSCADVDTDVADSIGVTVGRFNADDHLDVVFARAGGARSRVCLGDGAGAFSCADVSADTQDSNAVAAGDVNGDDELDLVFANVEQIPPVGFRNRVCLGDGAGAFTCNDVSTDSFRSQGVALADLDGDHIPDAVFANHNQQRNRVCIGDGAGAFTCADTDSDELASTDVAVVDLDRDGALDLVFANASPPTAERSRFCMNDGHAIFTCNDVSSDVAMSRGVAVGTF